MNLSSLAPWAPSRHVIVCRWTGTSEPNSTYSITVDLLCTVRCTTNPFKAGSQLKRMGKWNNIHNIYRYAENCVIYLFCIHQCLVNPSKMATPEKKGTQPSKMRSFAMQRQSAEQSMRLPWEVTRIRYVSGRTNQTHTLHLFSPPHAEWFEQTARRTRGERSNHHYFGKW